MKSRGVEPLELLGNQVPTFCVVPEGVGSEAADAADLASGYGLTPDPWQMTVLEGLLAVKPDGTWAASRGGLTVPRQNGKNGVIEIIELYKMVLRGRRILHTAHEVKTCRKAFLRLAGFFENPKKWPELAAMVTDIRRTNGQEAIVLNNGGSCEFIARSRSSGRGFTVDDLVMDEAQDLVDEKMSALLYTIAAAPSGDPQQLLAGTVPEDLALAEVFVRARDLAKAGGDGRLCWFEWSNPADADMSDPVVVANANPALGIRLRWGTVEDERASSDAAGFARERGGVWDGVGTGSEIDPDVWRGMGDERSRPAGLVAYAVEVPPGGKRASIGRAGERSDGRFHIEVDTQPGTTWAVDRLAELAKKRGAVVVLDGGSRAAALIPGLVARGVEPVVYGTRDVVNACSGFMDKLDEDRLRHLAQIELNIAVEAARRRKVGDAWAWHRRDTSVDISPLVAVTLAVHGLKETPPKRKTGRAMAV